MNITWETPPPKLSRGRGAGERGQWAAALKAHPGQWAKWPHPVASGSATWLSQHGFEVALRVIAGSDPKRYDMYACWPQDGTP